MTVLPGLICDDPVATDRFIWAASESPVRAPGAHRSWECALHDDDLKKVVERPEVFTVAGIQGKAGGERGRGDEQINRPGASSLTPSGDNRRENAAVCSCRVPIEWEGVEGSLSPLKAILSTGPLVRIAGSVGTGSKFGHGERADRDLDRKLRRVELVEVDHH